MYRAVAFILLHVSVFVLLHVNGSKVEVKVRQGKLIGTRELTIFDGKLFFAFYGVPYAQPPVEELRFKDPKPPKKWGDPYIASTEYHGACAQAHIAHKHGLYGVEDCLHLNIFTPSLPKTGSKLKAVIVWIHGYAFTSSFSHIYGPDFFIDNDVIFVTVTHRLGAFGFLKLNATDFHANMGLKDIVMALKWVKRNIKEFGGDEKNITVMGSGSGATLLSLLLTTKYNKLFSKMILQSGSIFSPSLLQGDHVLENSRLKDTLRKKGYKNIEYARTKDIIEVTSKVYSKVEVINKQRPLIPFLPIVEVKSNKSLLMKHHIKYYHNLQTLKINKPVLIGFNSQESISEMIPFLQNPHYLKAFDAHFKFMVPFTSGCQYEHSSRTYKEIADKIKKGYFKDGISEKSLEKFLKYATDLIKYPIFDFIHKYLKGDGRMYVYKFNYNGHFNAVKASATAGVNFKVAGAASGDEICYILKCEPIWENYVKANRENTSDRVFIKQITALWANFAKTGDPTPNTYKENVTWPAMTLSDDNVLHIGKVIKLIDSKSERRMFDLWNGIYREYYEHCKVHDEL